MDLQLNPIYNDEPTLAWFSEYDEWGASHRLRIAYRVWLRCRLAEAQNWKCCWCGRETTEVSGKKNSATLEHIVPRCQGGTDDPDNLAMACSRCNSKRKHTPVDKFLKHAIITYTKLPLNFELENA